MTTDDGKIGVVSSVMGFDSFNEQLESLVALLQLAFRRHNVEMTELEALRYLLWIDNTMFITLKQIGGPEFAMVTQEVQGQIAAFGMSAYVAFKTGQHLPPTGSSFGATHDEAAKNLAATMRSDFARVTPQAPPADDPRRGGYL